jgi:hypothetical protein
MICRAEKKEFITIFVFINILSRLWAGKRQRSEESAEE